MTLPNGVITNYGYDNASRVTSISLSTGGSCANPPSNLGNLTYTYDANGRRAAVGGTLASVNLPASVNGNTFNADNSMTAFNGQTLGYDANGNLLSDGTDKYTWDARNHLSGVGGANSANFAYDAFGRRMSTTINGTVSQFVYGGLNPVQELDGSSAVTANLLTGLGIDEYFAHTDSSGTMAFMRDALGSTVGMVGTGGSIGTGYTYQPFGATTVAGTNANPYQFTGRENDGTGLYFYRARYYSPSYQRFVSQDPIGFRGEELRGLVSSNQTAAALSAGAEKSTRPDASASARPRSFRFVDNR